MSGYTFATKKRDGLTTTQNSGVCYDAINKDGNKHLFYGYIEEIWELNYVQFCTALFRCSWVINRSEERRVGKAC